VPIQKPQAKGPDFQIEMPRSWIEAVSVGPGTTAAAVSPRRQRSFDVDHQLFCLPSENSVLLRIASVFSTKSKKFRTYQDNRIVSADHPCVIAIGLGEIEDASLMFNSHQAPFIGKAFLGVGPEVFVVPIGKPEPHEVVNLPRPSIPTLTGKDVSVAPFLSGDHSHISAVVLSPGTPFSWFWDSPGSDFHLLHNPAANVPLPEGVLPCRFEYNVKGGLLEKNKHTFPSDRPTQHC
jgi:hypothetical protein